MPVWLARLWLLSLQAIDRAHLVVLRWRHPGLILHPGASTNFVHAEFHLGPGARLEIHPGVVTERRRGGVRFILGAGATVIIGPDTWLRSDLGVVVIAAFEGATIELARECFLNGCHLSAKERLTLGWRAWVGPGTRVFDADQHDFDDTREERKEPLRLGECVWIASDCIVMRGAHVGDHAVVGARSVVTRPVPPHKLVVGSPAAVIGDVGDRSAVR